jgi:hypothetical protein
VQVEDRLAARGSDVDEHSVVLEPGAAGGFGDEVEDALRLLGGKLGDIAKRVDVTFRDDQEVGFGLRVDVADCYDTLALGDVVAVADELAEEAVPLLGAGGVARQRALPQA